MSFHSAIQAMTESLEELLAFIGNYLKPLSSSISVTSLVSHQGRQLDEKVPFILENAPIDMKPYLVAILCKLVHPLEYSLAARELLTSLENLDKEPVSVSFFSYDYCYAF